MISHIHMAHIICIQSKWFVVNMQTTVHYKLKGGGVARKIFELRQKTCRGGSNKGIL